MTRLLLAGCLVLCVIEWKSEASEGERTYYQRAEQAMHEGRLVDSEKLLLLALDENDRDDRARFQLGVVQVFRAVENLGRAMYEYGAISENARQPFLRLPVPKNLEPSTISFQSLGRVLDLFAYELGRAEATLAQITDDDVVMPMRLASIRFDFSGRRDQRTSLMEILAHLNRRPLPVTKKNPDFLVHFDRGDVAWLRAYCHLLSGLVEAYRSADERIGFADRVGNIFPKIEPTKQEDKENWYEFVPVADAPRLRRMRLHLVAVCELNKETWMHIRKETDDVYEWLPHPGQTDQLGMPITDAQIDAWLGMMDQMGGLLRGERLFPSAWVKWVNNDHPEGQGINFAKVFNNPPEDLFNFSRIQGDGINPIYLEPEKDRELFDPFTLLRVVSVFNGPFGLFSAARMN
ncbi:MAG: hypothetical protein AAGG48_12795 [Planctomycetota bacterium]